METIKLTKNFTNEDARSRNQEKPAKTHGNNKLRISNNELIKYINNNFKSLEIYKENRRNGNTSLNFDITVEYDYNNLYKSLKEMIIFYENDPNFFKKNLDKEKFLNFLEEIRAEFKESIILKEKGQFTLYK